MPPTTNRIEPMRTVSFLWFADMGAGLLHLVLRGTVKGRRSEERVSDDRVADERITNVLGKCHGHIMAMTDFMAMAMGVPCYGHDHAMSAVINMVMAVSWSWPCHSQGKCRCQRKHLRKIRAKAL